MRESGLWATLKRNLDVVRERGCSLEYDRVENSVGSGMADLNLVLDRKEFWIELKHNAKYPKRDSTKVKPGFRPNQPQWLTRRWGLCENTFILWQVERDYYLVPCTPINVHELEVGIKKADLLLREDWRVRSTRYAIGRLYDLTQQQHDW